MKKSGFVAIVGQPNVGKSTLLNRIIGQKIAIMSSKPQTTRTRIRGVLTNSAGQIVFLDTPGLHTPKHRLGEYMVEIAENSIREVDAILFVIDATHVDSTKDDEILVRLKASANPVILVINKVDAVDKQNILRLIDRYKEKFTFHALIPLSAKTGDQVDVLLDTVFSLMAEGPQYYPDDMITDHPEQFVMSEFIREKVLRLTREEVPHSVAVFIEHMEKREDQNTLHIHAVIYTERESQKAILIGKGGEMLKKVGTLARRDIEAIFDTKVFLELWVKVKKDWRNRENLLRSFGYDRD